MTLKREHLQPAQALAPRVMTTKLGERLNDVCSGPAENVLYLEPSRGPRRLACFKDIPRRYSRHLQLRSQAHIDRTFSPA